MAEVNPGESVLDYLSEGEGERVLMPAFVIGFWDSSIRSLAGWLAVINESACLTV